MKQFLFYMHKFFTGAVFRCCLILLAFSAMLLFALLQGGFVSWFIFYAFLPVVIYMLLILLYPLKSVHAVRHIHNTRLFAGDTLHVRLDLKRKRMFPLILVTVHDAPVETSDGRAVQGRKAIFFWMTRERSVTYSISGLKRGGHRLSTLHLQAGDPFGFFHRTVELECPSFLLVYPKVRPLPFDEAGIGTGSAIRPMSDVDMTQISGVRAYQPNDRLSWLDWKSSARTNRLITKQFEPEREMHASVMLVSGPDVEDMLFERSVSFAASLVMRLLKDGYSVVFTCSKAQRPLLLQGQSPKDMRTLFQSLAQLERPEALRAENVRLSGRKRRIGFAVSTDIGLAAEMNALASSSHYPQTMFYIADRQHVAPKLPHKSVHFSLYLVADDRFKHLIKVGG